MPLVSTAHGPVHYHVEGTGVPVLMLQGIGVSGTAWGPQMKGLRDRCQTVSVDNRGIGRSVPHQGPITIEAMASDGLAVMDAMGWASAHVVGHSMGGVIAQELALQAPTRVRSLSLLCTFARGRDGARLTPWVLWMTLRTRLGSRSMRRQAFLEMLYDPQEMAGRDLAALAAEVGGHVGRDLADSPPILMKQVRALSAHDASARLGGLGSVPTLVVSAAGDPIAKPEHGRRIAAGVPGARYVEIPGASHGVTMSQPERINALLAEFILGTEGRAVVGKGGIPGS